MVFAASASQSCRTFVNVFSICIASVWALTCQFDTAIRVAGRPPHEVSEQYIYDVALILFTRLSLSLSLFALKRTMINIFCWMASWNVPLDDGKRVKASCWKIYLAKDRAS